MNLNIGFVYKWTNEDNGKWYIGSHQGEIDDGYVGCGLSFTKAIKKYGIKNFKRIILYIGCDFRKEEEKILKKLDAANDKKSYNIKNEALGISLKKEKNGMWMKSHSEYSLKKISYSLRHGPRWTDKKKKEHSMRTSGENNGMYGRKHSQFSIDKIKQTKSNRKKDWDFLGNGHNHSNIFRKILRKLAVKGEYCSPRNLKIIELENFNYELPPYIRFMNFKSRKYNLDYLKKEFQWYLNGDKFDISITKYAKMWKNLVTDTGEIYSNYGQYIFGKENQFDRVVTTLKEDKTSRRASIIILNSNHLSQDVNDYPCTYSINFRIRDDKLNMSVHMRSQDAIYGMGNDAPCFSLIHEMMYISLKEIYKELKYGNYYHTADSFHVYEKHFGMLEKISDVNLDNKIKKTRSYDNYSLIFCPKISGIKEIVFLRKCNFSNIPNDFKFSKWLTTYKDYE